MNGILNQLKHNMIDKHTYVNIVRSEGTNYYKVIITKSFDISMFGKTKHYETNKMIPFYFKNKDIAKDFCNILPDKISKITFKIKWYWWPKEYIKKYITYELTVSNHKIYIYWDELNKEQNFGDNRVEKTIISKNNIVKYFVTDVMLYEDDNPCESSGPYFHMGENYEKISDLINYLNKDTIYSKNAEEYKFELIAQ